MHFIVDAQLPPALARILTAEGYSAEHVTDFAPGDTPDSVLWDRANEMSAILISKDEDFSEMALMRDPSPVIVWLRIGNTLKRDLIPWFVDNISQIVESVQAGSKIIEVR